MLVLGGVPSREQVHICTKRSKENYLQKCLGIGHVRFQEGILQKGDFVLFFNGDESLRQKS